MVRNYKRKTDRASINEGNVSAAVAEVIEGRLSYRVAAEKYNLQPATLQHRVEKARTKGQDQRDISSKYASSQVFSAEEERLLNEYITKCSKMHYGPTLVQVRKLAYEYARTIKCKRPPAWDRKKIAGVDWMNGFRNRNSNLSLRKPENTSAARSFGFNKKSVNEFFNNLESVLTQYKFTGDRIYNFDESGISTVLSTPKILAEKKQKQVGQLVSAERGELVTFGGIISATGNTVPPLFVFPRVHYKDHFISEAPEGSLEVANRSGWINSEIFINVLKHIQKHTNCSKENPILLLCDNHESRITLEAVNYCREYGIVYLSFPPHTSHRLQPLDVGVFGPFKCKLKMVLNDWHVNNPGKTLTIYNIPKLGKMAYFEAFTAKNINSGFSKPGIWPYNKLAFEDDDFVPCEMYSESVSDKHPNEQTDDNKINKEKESVEGIEKPQTPENPSTSKILITPDSVRPYPKIVPKQKTKKGREPGKSRIYTDTPEKMRLEELEKIKNQKRLEKERRQRAKNLKCMNLLLGVDSTKREKNPPKKRHIEDSSDTSESGTVELMDTSDGSEHYSSEEDMLDPTNETVAILECDITEDDFILVKFPKKKSVVYYVAKITSKIGLSEFNVSYLRKKPASWTFVFPNVLDTAIVDILDITLKLPRPVVTNATNRTANMFTFAVDLSRYDVQ